MTASPAASPKLVLHYLNDSRSQRILWMLEELEVPYELKYWKRTPDRTAPRELADIHPLGTAPVITDGDITVAESGAIVDYLAKKHGDGKILVPPSGQLDDVYFSHYAEGSLMPWLVIQLIFSIIPERSPWLTRPLMRILFSTLTASVVTPRLKQNATFIENHLSKCGEWFAGGQGPTSADFMMSFALEAWAHGDPSLLGPKTLEYVKRVHSRPAYQRGLEKAGEYRYATDTAAL
ncbi:thioredoxin-like protein [Cytidiella melzeri]|nr:thioredoxin-like protein [Cytidiella melzeri]